MSQYLSKQGITVLTLWCSHLHSACEGLCAPNTPPAIAMYFSSDNPSNRKRNHRVHVYLNDEEFQQLNIMVAYTNKSREAVLRELIMGLTVKEKPPVEYGEIVRELRRIGSNVNQLTTTLHAHGFVDEPELEAIGKDVRRMERRFADVFAQEDK